MEDQAHQQPQAAATQEIGDLSSTTGPSTTQVLRVVMLVLLSGVLLLLAGITLLGTLIGLTVTAPLFILFSPVLIPAVLTIGLVATGFLTVVAFVLTALFFFMRMNSPRTRMREQYTIPGGELKDAGALNSLTSLGPSDSRPSASVDNGKGKRVMVVDQQQQNNGKRTHRKAVDLDASSLSATSMESNIYHVFLSFSGRDTRKQFTDHLYHGLVNSGISTFRDNMLTVGEKFSANLFHAIKNSKISVPVISQSYASSIWCLQELALMVECMKSSGHVILPIFYRVEPSDVRHQKGDFGKLFSHSTEKYEKKDVEKWKQALHKVADLNGWPSEMTADGREAELVKLVVTRVWSELKKAFQLVVDPEQPVGIDNAVEEVLRLLVNPNATKIVCIHGMGGIGKTTLAKVIYNKLLDQFLHHSFITNIRGNKILSLQNQLICDILKTKDEEPTTDQAIRTMEFGFKLRKVLILLDDVDHIDQVKSFVGKHEWFEKGSRIIITTRIKSILKDDEVICNYELKEIDEHQSLILFSRHAFLKDSPLRKFASLSDQIINITGRLPLALKVIGSFLCGKDIAFWERALEKLKEVQPKDVKEKLEISYNALEPEEQQIFLDIACFFIGTDLRIASYMWKACRFFSAGIDTLINMSLIKIGDNHELIMHNQLRDLGRRIASKGEPMKRTRLWVHDEALKVLEDEKVNKKIEALRLNQNGSSKFMEQESFKRLTKLRFLHFTEVDFVGDFENSILRWLKWERCGDSFKAKDVHLKELLILDLSGGFISKNWGGWSSIRMEMLKVLNLSGCFDLKSTPNLSKFKSLEMLILENCENLEEIDHSIGDVNCLVSLNLRFCGRLEKLPEELDKLEKLKELFIDGTDIRKIPSGIESMKKLEKLSAVGCHLLTQVPSSIIRSVSLSTLNLNVCKTLQELSDSFEAGGELQRLSLERCFILKEIPSSIGKLKTLVELDLSSTRIKELPESIGELKKLIILRISDSKIEKLPSAIGELESLQELDASRCYKLEGEIPVYKGGLSSLRTLRLGGAKISSLPENFYELSTLEHLDLLYCSELEAPIKFPSGLSTLQLTCRSDTLPSLSHLSYLKKLTLHSCMSLQGIPALPPCIQKLRVWKCPKLDRFANLSKLESLSELELLQCYGLDKLDGLEALESLRKLDVSTSTELSNLDDFEDLESLRYLDLPSYDGKVDDLHAIGGLGLLKSLEVLNISARKHIRRLNLSNSKDLKQLIVNNCKSLDEIRFHKNIKSLERFDTNGCKPHITRLLADDRT